MSNTKAWAVFELKAFDAAERTFEGIASTPIADRMEDVVEPKGAKFKLPIPMLWQHGKEENKDPIGWVLSAKVTDKGIFVKGKIAKLDSPPSLKEDLDRSWALMSSKLVNGLSIGFRPLEDEPIKNSYGLRITSWEWLELSVVRVAANPDAQITSLSVKSADMETLAALGDKRRSVVRLGQPPGATGITAPTRGNPMTIKEQISAWEAKRAASDARMAAIMSKSTESMSTPDAAEEEEYDTLAAEVESIDKQLVRLKAQEKRLVSEAKPVTHENTSDEKKAAATRNGVQVLSKELPKGTLFARYVGALATCKGNTYEAAEYARQQWGDSTPDLEKILRNSLHMKSAVEAGDTTTSGWASQLIPAAQQMQNEFLELLRPATLIGRIPGLRNVPFNIAVPIQTGGGTYGWVGEGRRKPVTSMSFDSVTLRWSKAAGIVVLTHELVRFSTPSAEAVVRDQMIKGCAAFLDTQFIDPAVAAITNVSPGSITNGVTPVASTGTTAAAFRANMQTALSNMITNNQDPSTVVVLMSATVALNLSLLQNALGQPEFPGISLAGGSILGLPVVVSQAVGARIILLNTDQILVAQDGGITVDASNQATIEMDTEPLQGETSPITTSGPQRNMFQDNMIALRVEKWIAWVRGRTSAVEYISNASYSG